ncbi:MAG: 4Fe-4S dicluster domain-containing protein, partial [Clostridia bacterium]|nr:4Fe-4S dicluster domain-containing protein [Clostridia bacterium]
DYATVLANAPRHAYSGQCTYCGHCKPCPVNIDIAMVNKLYDLATMQEDVPASVKEHYMNLDAHADDCLGCGACESRCPFDVPVIEKMKTTAKLFE